MSENDSGSTLEWLSKHPLVALGGFVIGLVSLILGIYFGFISLRNRELAYHVNPTKTAIVRSGQSSDLQIIYKGQSVSSDVTGLLVVVWNDGRESIRSENVLTPLTLTTSPKVPILEARIKKVNRSVCQVGLDTSQSANGSVSMMWKILEHNDGAAVQLIVAGPATVTVKAEGVVEGQDGIHSDESSEHGERPHAGIMTALVLTVFGVIMVFQMIGSDPKLVRRFGKWFVSLFVVCMCCAVWLFVYDYVTGPSVPPIFR
jgi:hypothetical protein